MERGVKDPTARTLRPGPLLLRPSSPVTIFKICHVEQGPLTTSATCLRAYSCSLKSMSSQCNQWYWLPRLDWLLRLSDTVRHCECCETLATLDIFLSSIQPFTKLVAATLQSMQTPHTSETRSVRDITPVRARYHSISPRDATRLLSCRSDNRPPAVCPQQQYPCSPPLGTLFKRPAIF